MAEHERASGLKHRRGPGITLLVAGLLLLLSSPVLIWLCRGKLAEVGPHGFLTLWYGAGGMALLDFTAGLPLGAVLVALAVTLLRRASRPAGRVFLPLLGGFLVYFAYHAVLVFRYPGSPLALFAALGCVQVGLFFGLVGVWAGRRAGISPAEQKTVDLQMAGSVCFFTAAWEACGLAGAPGFAVSPELAVRLGNRSFLVGQAVAVQLFTALGFVLLIVAMRGKSARGQL